jgi:hypothetical protein
MTEGQIQQNALAISNDLIPAYEFEEVTLPS